MLYHGNTMLNTGGTRRRTKNIYIVGKRAMRRCDTGQEKLKEITETYPKMRKYA